MVEKFLREFLLELSAFDLKMRRSEHFLPLGLVTCHRPKVPPVTDLKEKLHKGRVHLVDLCYLMDQSILCVEEFFDFDK